MARRLSSRVLPLALGVWALGLASPALAGPPDPAEAEDLARRGIDLRRNGDDAGALPLFQKAYQLAPNPRSAVQLGLVEQALGRWADAEEHLAEGLKSPRDPWIRKNRPVIEESMRTVKSHVGSVEVTGDPPGAEVLVNGRAVGQLPLGRVVRVSAGSVDVEVNAAGYQRGFRTINVGAGQTQTVVMRLEKQAVAALPLSTPTAPAEPPPSGTPAPTDTPPSSPAPWQRWVAIGALAGGGAAAGVGIYGLLRYNDRVGSFNHDCEEGPSGSGAVDKATHQPSKRCGDLQSEYRGARTVMIVGFSVAGALAATGVVLLLTAPESPRPAAERSVSWACAPTLGAWGAACAARF